MTLAEECVLFTRYLLDCDPSPDLVARYEAAHDILAFSGSDRELRFVHRHPWSLPYLDAAAGFLSRSGVLRKKVYLMAAILEATPEHAEFFLRPPVSFWPLLACVLWQGIRSTVKAAVGLPLLLLARRTA